jgi:AAA+ ATPase superfamily predicted ATPase
MSFIGREAELARLAETLNKKTASFVLVKGRRRIGKSRLVHEFSKQFQEHVHFTGLPPHEEMTAQSQIDEFSRQFARNFRLPVATYQDWSDVFLALAERVRKKKTLIFFDEISWMGSKDPAFLGKIKNFWDMHLKNNPSLVFIVCGSASAWIDKNILSHSGFVGRVTFALTLKELPLKDCDKFWPKYVSFYEKLKVLAVTGGVPKYLEEINPKECAEKNIERLCFRDGGLLVNEFEHIFSDIFLHESDLYRAIIRLLANGPNTVNNIIDQLNVKSRGKVNEYLWELELAGFVTRDFTWQPKTGSDSKLSKYRLSDNYLRFYVKYIEGNKNKIQRGDFSFSSMEKFSGWQGTLGLQFENLVLNNRQLLFSELGIFADDVVSSNPFFQRKTQRQRGCQIDLMVQTNVQSLYVCEIKFSKHKVGMQTIHDVKEKIERLTYPKGFSLRPVLIHVNGVTDEVIDENFFVHNVDFGELMS